MKYNKKFSKSVERFIIKNLEKAPLPQQKGNKIAVGNILVKKTPLGYRVIDTKAKKMIAETYHKLSALAIARQLSMNHNVVDRILDLDQELAKLTDESRFYWHTMTNNQDTCRRFSAETRYDIAHQKTQNIRRSLDRYIYT